MRIQKARLLLLLALLPVAGAGFFAQAGDRPGAEDAALEAGEAHEAGVDDAAASGDAAAQVEKRDERVCRNMQVTGSRFGRKVCHTREEWALLDRRTKDVMREIESLPQGWKDD